MSALRANKRNKAVGVGLVIWLGVGWGGGCSDGSSAEEGVGASSSNGASSSSGGTVSLGGETASAANNAGGASDPGTGATGATNTGGTGANTYNGDCVSGGTQCNNCVDDDDDGNIDSLDSECSGPLDDDESSFATGIPGDNIDFCQDCFFDGDSGEGNDGCRYNTDCLYGEDPSGTSDCFDCNVSDQCVNYCQAYTPNGCDCFGCCDISTTDGEVHTVLLEASCTIDDLADDSKCTPCVKSTDCANDCQHCELCLGKDTLPADCEEGMGGAPGAGGAPGGQVCSGGQDVCNDIIPCVSGYYCVTGCCVPIVK